MNTVTRLAIRSRQWTLVVAACLGLLATSCAWGVVTDSQTGQAVPGAMVTFHDSEGKSGTTFAGEGGLYAFDLANGPIPQEGLVSYQVTAPGYEPLTVQREVMYDDNAAGTWEVQHFSLNPVFTPTATPVVDGSAEGPVLLDGTDFSKLDGFGLQRGLEVVQSYWFTGEIKTGKYSGALSRWAGSREDVVALYDFVRRGGRAVVFASPGTAFWPEVNAAFQEFFGISFAWEYITSTGLPSDGSLQTPLWRDLQVGYAGATEYQDFLIPASPYDCKTYTSETSGMERCISAYRTLDRGEILFLLQGYGESPYCTDWHIDTLDNKTACLELVKYLAGRIDYPR